jgi:hypothetical protein
LARLAKWLWSEITKIVTNDRAGAAKSRYISGDSLGWD